MKNADLSRDLRVALNTKPDYSETFTRQVTSLQHIIADALSAPVEHDDDMNYSSAQKLVVWLDKECHLVAPYHSLAVYRLIDFVSSRDRFFTFVTLSLSASPMGWKEKGLEKSRRYWSLLAKDNLPDEIKDLQKRIVSIMESNHYTLVEGSILSHEAKGHLTDMDGRPATVFEVLFSELC